MAKGGLRDTLARLGGSGGSTRSHVLRMATLNAALRLKRDDIGLVAPGRRAELAVLSDLAGVVVARVYVAVDELVAREAAAVCADWTGRAPSTAALRDSVKLDPVIGPECFDDCGCKGVTDGRVRLPVVGGVSVWCIGMRWMSQSCATAWRILPAGSLPGLPWCIGMDEVNTAPMVCLANGWGEPHGRHRHHDPA